MAKNWKNNVLPESDSLDLGSIVYDSDTSLPDIAKKYTDLGGQINDLTRAAAEDVGTRQTKLIGNDFGGVNPMMYATYYQPSVTGDLADLRVTGTEKALEEGMERGKAAAEANLNAAKNSYNSALDGYNNAKEAFANLKTAMVDSSMLPEGTSESEAFAYQALTGNKEDAIYSATKWYADSQNMPWDNKNIWSNAAKKTVADSGVDTSNFTQSDWDSFWADNKNGTAFTNYYMEEAIQKDLGDEALAKYKSSYNAVIDYIEDVCDYANGIKDTLPDGDIDLFFKGSEKSPSLSTYTPVVTFFDQVKDYIAHGGTNEDDAYAYAFSKYTDEDWINQNIAEEYRDDIKKLATDSWQTIAKGSSKDIFTQTYIAKEATLAQAGITSNLSRYLTDDGKKALREVTENYFNALQGKLKAEGEKDDVANTTLNDVLSNSFGFDLEDLRWLTQWRKDNPTEYQEYSNQLAMAYGQMDAIEVADGERYYLTNNGYEQLPEGTPVFFAPSGAYDSEGNIRSDNLKEFINVWKDYYSADVDNISSEELTQKQTALNDAYGEYMKEVSACQMVSSIFHTAITSDVYNAVLASLGDPGSSDDYEIFGMKVSDFVKQFKDFSDKDHNAALRYYYSLINTAYQRNGSFLRYSNVEGKLVYESLKYGKDSDVGAQNKLQWNEGGYKLPNFEKDGDDATEEAAAALLVLTRSMEKFNSGSKDKNVDPDFMKEDFASEFAKSWGGQVMGAIDFAVSLVNGLKGLVRMPFTGEAFWDYSGPEWSKAIFGEQKLADKFTPIFTGDAKYDKSSAWQQGEVAMKLDDKAREFAKQTVNPLLVDVYFSETKTIDQVKGVADVYTLDGKRFWDSWDAALKFGIDMSGMVAINYLQGAFVSGAVAPAIAKMANKIDKVAVAAKAKVTSIGKQSAKIAESISWADNLDDPNSVVNAAKTSNIVDNYLDDTARETLSATRKASPATSADDVLESYNTVNTMGTVNSKPSINAQKVLDTADDWGVFNRRAANALASLGDGDAAQLLNTYGDSTKLLQETLDRISEAAIKQGATTNPLNDSMTWQKLGFYELKMPDGTVHSPQQVGLTMLADRVVGASTLSGVTGIAASEVAQLPDAARRFLLRYLSTATSLDDATPLVNASLKQFMNSLGPEGFKRVTQEFINRAKLNAAWGRNWDKFDVYRALGAAGWEKSGTAALGRIFLDDAILDPFRDFRRNIRNPQLDDNGNLRVQTVGEYYSNPENIIQNLAWSALHFGKQRLQDEATTYFNTKNYRKEMAAFDATSEKYPEQAARHLAKAQTYLNGAIQHAESAWKGGKSYDEVMKTVNMADDLVDKSLNETFKTSGWTLDYGGKTLEFKTAKEFKDFALSEKANPSELAFNLINGASAKAINYFAMLHYSIGSNVGELGALPQSTYLKLWSKMNDTYNREFEPFKKARAPKDGQKLSHDQILKNTHDFYEIMKADLKSANINGEFGLPIKNFDKSIDTWFNQIEMIGKEGLENGTIPVLRYGYLPLSSLLYHGSYDDMVESHKAAGTRALFTSGEIIDTTSADPSEMRQQLSLDKIIKAMQNGEKTIDYIDKKGKTQTAMLDYDGLNFVDALNVYHNGYISHKYLNPIFGKDFMTYSQSMRNGNAYISLEPGEILRQRQSTAYLAKGRINGYKSKKTKKYVPGHIDKISNLAVKQGLISESEKSEFKKTWMAKTKVGEKTAEKLGTSLNKLAAAKRNKDKALKVAKSGDIPDSAYPEVAKVFGFSKNGVGDAAEGKRLWLRGEAVAKTLITAYNKGEITEDSGIYTVSGKRGSGENKKTLYKDIPVTSELMSMLDYAAKNNGQVTSDLIAWATIQYDLQTPYFSKETKNGITTFKYDTDYESALMKKYNPEPEEAETAIKAKTNTKAIVASSTQTVKAETMSGKITVKMLKDNSDKVFLFGDNAEDAKTGYASKTTQAVIRRQKNAIGIPTKKSRGTKKESYFTDADFNEFKKGVDNAISKAKKSGKQIVIPEAGIGTGAAQLAKRAPKCFKYLTNELDKLKNGFTATTASVDNANGALQNTTGVTKIISGGQTGVDMIGLEVGKEFGVETGGTAAPKFFREKGIDSYDKNSIKAFGLEEISAEDQLGKKGKEFYSPRTEANVKNSDGTVYFSSGEDTAGYTATLKYAIANNKPFILDPTAAELNAWMKENNINTLNVAGSRGSASNITSLNKAKKVLQDALSGNFDANEAKTARYQNAANNQNELFKKLPAKARYEAMTLQQNGSYVVYGARAQQVDADGNVTVNELAGEKVPIEFLSKTFYLSTDDEDIVSGSKESDILELRRITANELYAHLGVKYSEKDGEFKPTAAEKRLVDGIISRTEIEASEMKEGFTVPEFNRLIDKNSPDLEAARMLLDTFAKVKYVNDEGAMKEKSLSLDQFIVKLSRDRSIPDFVGLMRQIALNASTGVYDSTDLGKYTPNDLIFTCAKVVDLFESTVDYSNRPKRAESIAPVFDDEGNEIENEAYSVKTKYTDDIPRYATSADDELSAELAGMMDLDFDNVKDHLEAFQTVVKAMYDADDPLHKVMADSEFSKIGKQRIKVQNKIKGYADDLNDEVKKFYSNKKKPNQKLNSLVNTAKDNLALRQSGYLSKGESGKFVYIEALGVAAPESGLDSTGSGSYGQTSQRYNAAKYEQSAGATNNAAGWSQDITNARLEAGTSYGNHLLQIANGYQRLQDLTGKDYSKKIAEIRNEFELMPTRFKVSTENPSVDDLSALKYVSMSSGDNFENSMMAMLADVHDSKAAANIKSVAGNQFDIDQANKVATNVVSAVLPSFNKDNALKDNKTSKGLNVALKDLSEFAKAKQNYDDIKGKMLSYDDPDFLAAEKNLANVETKLYEKYGNGVDQQEFTSNLENRYANITNALTMYENANSEKIEYGNMTTADLIAEAKEGRRLNGTSKAARGKTVVTKYGSAALPDSVVTGKAPMISTDLIMKAVSPYQEAPYISDTVVEIKYMAKGEGDSDVEITRSFTTDFDYGTGSDEGESGKNLVIFDENGKPVDFRDLSEVEKTKFVEAQNKKWEDQNETSRIIKRGEGAFRKKKLNVRGEELGGVAKLDANGKVVRVSEKEAQAEGLPRLKAQREEVVKEMAIARERGDLSENSEYQAARDRLRAIDKEIADLERSGGIEAGGENIGEIRQQLDDEYYVVDYEPSITDEDLAGVTETATSDISFRKSVYDKDEVAEIALADYAKRTKDYTSQQQIELAKKAAKKADRAYNAAKRSADAAKAKVQKESMSIDDVAKKVLSAEDYASFKKDFDLYHECTDNKDEGFFRAPDGGFMIMSNEEDIPTGYTTVGILLKSLNYDPETYNSDISEDREFTDKEIAADEGPRKKMQKEINKNLRRGNLAYGRAKEFKGPSQLDLKSRTMTINSLLTMVDQCKKAAGLKELDPDNVVVDKKYAEMLYRYSREGIGPSTLKSKGKALLAEITQWNKFIQQTQLAGGASYVNALSIAKLRGAILSDPVKMMQYTKMVTDYKDDAAVRNFVVTNSKVLTDITMKTFDSTILTDFQRSMSNTPGLSDVGMVGALGESIAEYRKGKNYIARTGYEKYEFASDAVQNIADSIFGDSTFQRFLPVLRAKLLIENYDNALRLIEAKFPGIDQDSLNDTACKFAYARTEAYFHPERTASGLFKTKKIDEVLQSIYDHRYRDFVASWTGAEADVSLGEMASNMFFALGYKNGMIQPFYQGLKSTLSPAELKARWNLRGTHELSSDMSISGNELMNQLGTQFMQQGNRNMVKSLALISCMAFLSAKALGLATSWDDLRFVEVDSDGNPLVDAEGHYQYKIPDILKKFQTIGQIWIPNYSKEKGFYIDPTKTNYKIDTMSSMFTLQNTAWKTIDRAINPNAYYSAPQRGVGLIGQELGINPQGLNNILNQPVARAIGDELIASNLLSPYKAMYEIVMDASYYGNNIWEKKYLPDGSLNKNYDPYRNMKASLYHFLGFDEFLDKDGYNRWVKGYYTGKYKAQDQVGTIAGAGVFQHEYTTALKYFVEGKMLEGVTEGGELPIKKERLSSTARTDFNVRVKNIIAQYASEYRNIADNTTDADKIDAAYVDFVKKSADAVASWSKKYDYVLGKDQSLVPFATRALMAMLSGEYDDNLDYIQNTYWKASAIAQIEASGPADYWLNDNDLDNWIKSGKTTEEFAAEKNKRTNAYYEALDNEYKARKALHDAGFDNEYLAGMSYENLRAEQRLINKEVYMGAKKTFESKIGEFDNFKEMKAYFEAQIDAVSSTKSKARLANQYNKYVTDVLAPYVEKYGAAIISDGYYNNDYLSNSLAEYIIIPADKYYSGKTPKASYLKDLFHVGYTDKTAMPSDDEVIDAYSKARVQMNKGYSSSAAAMLEQVINDIKRGRLYVNDSDYNKIVRMKALLSARSK